MYRKRRNLYVSKASLTNGGKFSLYVRLPLISRLHRAHHQKKRSCLFERVKANVIDIGVAEKTGGVDWVI